MAHKGTVYLVGAGPGDQGLISAKGLTYLEQADVVLYDRLVNPLLLEKTKYSAELIYAGKLPQRHFLRQEAIHDEMVRHAQAGKMVVRLKGGDPSVFGRVGEEADFLDEYDISYEIVPGISAGIAAPAYAGVPVTHRLYGTSFAIAAGHRKGEEELELDWKALAAIDTVAFYMGVKNLPAIVENLLKNGREKTESVLVIQWGSTSKQKTIKADLQSIVSQVEKELISNPAITLVGAVASQYNKKSWFERKPLFASAPLILNDEDSFDLVDNMQAEGAETFLYPRWRKTSVDMPEIDFSKYKEIAFQDSGDVEQFFTWLEEQETDLRQIQAVFTARTEKAKESLRRHGLIAQPRISDVPKLVLASESSNCEEGYFFQQTVQKTKANSSRIVLQRLLEEERITEIVVPSVKAIELLFDLYNQNQAFQKLEILCFKPDVNEKLNELGIPATYRSLDQQLSYWLQNWYEGQVEQDAGDFIHRSWESSGARKQTVSSIH